jgi:hypothetical protein
VTPILRIAASLAAVGALFILVVAPNTAAASRPLERPRATSVSVSVSGDYAADEPPVHGGIGLYSSVNGHLIRTLFVPASTTSYEWVSAPVTGSVVYLLAYSLKGGPSIVSVPGAGGKPHAVVKLPSSTYGYETDTVAVSISGKRAAVLNTHLEVWSATTKKWVATVFDGKSLAGFLPDGHTLVLLRGGATVKVEELNTADLAAGTHVVATIHVLTCPKPGIGPTGLAGIVDTQGDVSVVSGGCWVGSGHSEMEAIGHGKVIDTVAISTTGIAVGAISTGDTRVVQISHQDCYGEGPLYGVRDGQVIKLRVAKTCG